MGFPAQDALAVAGWMTLALASLVWLASSLALVVGAALLDRFRFRAVPLLGGALAGVGFKDGVRAVFTNEWRRSLQHLGRELRYLLPALPHPTRQA